MLKKDKNLKDINFILDNLRQEDYQEIVAVWGENWRETFIKNTINTDFVILVKNNTPIAMGGFTCIDKNYPEIACVWLICSKYVKNNKKLLFSVIKNLLKNKSSKFKIMYNHIYKSNFSAKKWLKRLGFKFDNPHPDKLDRGENFEFFYKLNTMKG